MTTLKSRIYLAPFPVWNMKYDINTLVKWCKEHSVRVFNMIENLHESLNDE